MGGRQSKLNIFIFYSNVVLKLVFDYVFMLLNQFLNIFADTTPPCGNVGRGIGKFKHAILIGPTQIDSQKLKIKKNKKF